MNHSDDAELEHRRLLNYLRYLDLQEVNVKTEFDVRLKRIDEQRQAAVEELAKLGVGVGVEH